MALTFDSKKNFAYSVVATAPSPATSGTSLVVAAGDGAKFPAAPFNAVVWPTGVEPTTSNAEIVRVTNVSTDTFTITRTQESSNNRSVVVNDQIAQNVTVKYLTDLESGFQTASAAITPVGVIQMWMTGSAPTGWLLLQGQNVSRTTYAELFALWNTTFGAGDGSTTFGLPDFQQYIPIGKAAAGTVSTLGVKTGSFDHTHASGTLAVASHTHGSGTLSVASHTHDSGTLAVASHTHGPGTLTVASHSHTMSVETTFTDISHTHSTPNHTHTYSGTTDNASASVFASLAGGATGVIGTHSHTYSGTTDSTGGSTTGSAGGTHRHSVSGQSTDAAAPAVSSGLTASTAPSVNSGSTGSTSPTVNAGATGGTAPAVSSGSTATANPPVIAVNFIVRAQSAI
jgi:microcystin-dependent protein